MWFVLLIGLPLFLGLGMIGLGWIVFKIMKRAEHFRPIVCVCRVNGRIGVVLRRDYNKASKRFWSKKRPYYFANRTSDSFIHAQILEIPEAFVFTEGPEFFTLIRNCYIEKATFHVPTVPEEGLNQIKLAHLYLYHRPWDGKLID